MRRNMTPSAPPGTEAPSKRVAHDGTPLLNTKTERNEKKKCHPYARDSVEAPAALQLTTSVPPHPPYHGRRGAKSNTSETGANKDMFPSKAAPRRPDRPPRITSGHASAPPPKSHTRRTNGRHPNAASIQDVAAVARNDEQGIKQNLHKPQHTDNAVLRPVSVASQTSGMLYILSLILSRKLSKKNSQELSEKLAEAGRDVQRVDSLMHQSLFARHGTAIDAAEGVLDHWSASLSTFIARLKLICDLLDENWRATMYAAGVDVAHLLMEEGGKIEHGKDKIIPETTQDEELMLSDVLASLSPASPSLPTTEDWLATPTNTSTTTMTTATTTAASTSTTTAEAVEAKTIATAGGKKKKMKYVRLDPQLMRSLDSFSSLPTASATNTNATRPKRALADAVPVADKPTFATEIRHRCTTLSSLISSFALCSEHIQYCPPTAHKYLHNVFFSGDVAFNITPKDNSICPFDIKALPILSLLPDILSCSLPRGVVQSSTGSGKTILTPVVLCILAYKDVYTLPTTERLPLALPAVLLSLPSSTIVNEKVTFYGDKHSSLPVLSLQGGGRAQLDEILTTPQYHPTLVIGTPSTALNTLYRYDGDKLDRMRVILDEAHDRKAHLDVLLSRLCRMQGLQSPLALMLMSATPDDDVSNLLGQSHTHNFLLPTQELYKVALERVEITRSHEVFDKVLVGGVKVLDEMVSGDPFKPRGHTLIFMSGLQECEKVGKLLGKELRHRSKVASDFPHGISADAFAHIPEEISDEISDKNPDMTSSGPNTNGKPLYYVLETTISNKLDTAEPFYNALEAEMKEALRSEAATSQHTFIWIVVLTGRVSRLQQEIAQAPFPDGLKDVLKVIVATNAIESSVTIEGLTALVDSGLHKESRYDPEKGVSILEQKPISEASRTQRKGRVGRISCGSVVQVIMNTGKREKVNHNIPAILASDPGQIIMQMRKIGILLESINDDLPSPLPHASLQKTLDELTCLGLIDEAGLTPKGRQVSILDDLKPIYGVAVYDAYIQEPAQGYIVLLLITVMTAFSKGFSDRDCGRELLKAVIDPHSELSTLTNIFLASLIGLPKDTAARYVGVVEKEFKAAKTMLTNGIRALNSLKRGNIRDKQFNMAEVYQDMCSLMGPARYTSTEVVTMAAADKVHKDAMKTTVAVLRALRHPAAVRAVVSLVLSKIEATEVGWLASREYVTSHFEPSKNLVWYLPASASEELFKSTDLRDKERHCVRMFKPDYLPGQNVSERIYLLEKSINNSFATPMVICSLYHSADPALVACDHEFVGEIMANNGHILNASPQAPPCLINTYTVPQSLFHSPFVGPLLDVLFGLPPIPLKGEGRNRSYSIAPVTTFDREAANNSCLFTIVSRLCAAEVASVLNTAKNLSVDFVEDLIIQSDDRVAVHCINTDTNTIRMAVKSVGFLDPTDYIQAQKEAEKHQTGFSEVMVKIYNHNIYKFTLDTIKMHIRQRKDRSRGAHVDLRPVLIYPKDSLSLHTATDTSSPDSESEVLLENGAAQLPLHTHSVKQNAVFPNSSSCFLAYMSESPIESLKEHLLTWTKTNAAAKTAHAHPEFDQIMEKFPNIGCFSIASSQQPIASYSLPPFFGGFISRKEKKVHYPVYMNMNAFINAFIDHTERRAASMEAVYTDSLPYFLQPQQKVRGQPTYTFGTPANVSALPELKTAGAYAKGRTISFGKVTQFYALSPTGVFPDVRAIISDAIPDGSGGSIPISIPKFTMVSPESFSGITLHVTNPLPRANDKSDVEAFAAGMRQLQNKMGCLIVASSPLNASGPNSNRTTAFQVTLPTLDVLPLYVKMFAAQFNIALISDREETPVIAFNDIDLPLPNFKADDTSTTGNANIVMSRSFAYKDWLAKLIQTVATPTPLPSMHWRTRCLMSVTPVYLMYANMPIRITFPADESSVFEQAATCMGITTSTFEGALYAEVDNMADLLEYYTRVPSTFGHVQPMVAKYVSTCSTLLDRRELKERAGVMRAAVSSVLNVIPGDVSTPIIFSNALMVCFVRHPTGHVKKMTDLYKRSGKNIDITLSERVTMLSLASQLPAIPLVLDVAAETVGMGLPESTLDDDDDVSDTPAVLSPDEPELSDLIDERVVARFPAEGDIPASCINVRFIDVRVTRREAAKKAIEGYLPAHDTDCTIDTTATTTTTAAAANSTPATSASAATNTTDTTTTTTSEDPGPGIAKTTKAGKNKSEKRNQLVSPTWSFLQWYFTDDVSSNEDLIKKANIQLVNDKERWDDEHAHLVIAQHNGSYKLTCSSDKMSSPQIENLSEMARLFAQAYSLKVQVLSVSAEQANYMRVIAKKNKKFNLTCHFFPEEAFLMFDVEHETAIMKHLANIKRLDEASNLDLDVVAKHAISAQEAWIRRLSHFGCPTFFPRLEDHNLEACIMCCDGPTQLRDSNLAAWIREMKEKPCYDDGDNGLVNTLPADVTFCVTCFHDCMLEEISLVKPHPKEATKLLVDTLALNNGQFTQMNPFSSILPHDGRTKYHLYHNVASVMHHFFNKIPSVGSGGSNRFTAARDSVDPLYLSMCIRFKVWLRSLSCLANPRLAHIFHTCPQHVPAGYYLSPTEVNCAAIVQNGTRCGYSWCAKCESFHGGLCGARAQEDIEKAVTLACPCCGAAYLDFTGCCAVQCASCGQHFCGLCVCYASNSTAVHEHVLRDCRLRGTVTDYFHSAERITAANNIVKKEKVMKVVARVDSHLRASLYELVKHAIADLGIGLSDFNAA